MQGVKLDLHVRIDIILFLEFASIDPAQLACKSLIGRVKTQWLLSLAVWFE